MTWITASSFVLSQRCQTQTKLYVNGKVVSIPTNAYVALTKQADSTEINFNAIPFKVFKNGTGSKPL